ncbi:DUF3658 domain-containing protein [Bacillus spongiae]|uniref:DUF3658 domain-containing protein n=2 Tax=Bacillus spongiae TaxID=2683610 RepID=A0ABU8HKK2_9BACI
MKNFLWSLRKLMPFLTIFWCGDNAHEQTGLRLVLYLLKEKSNPTRVINVSNEYHSVSSEVRKEQAPLTVGEAIPEKLAAIYQETVVQEVPLMQRKELEKEWLVLSESDDTLRLWQNDYIQSVTEDYFDEIIIQSLQKLQDERGSIDFIKSARLIGEVLGQTLQIIGDGFIEYRVRELIVNGVLDIKGVPKAMRFYEVKFRSPRLIVSKVDRLHLVRQNF